MDADAGEEMTLGEAGKVFGLDFMDGPFIDHATGDLALLNQVAQPCGLRPVELVVVGAAVHRAAPLTFPAGPDILSVIRKGAHARWRTAVNAAFITRHFGNRSVAKLAALGLDIPGLEPTQGGPKYRVLHSDGREEVLALAAVGARYLGWPA